MGAYSGGMFKNGQIVDVVYVHGYPYGTAHGNLRVYIKSAMPLISQPRSLYTKVQYIDSSCFINTNECKPAVSKRVNTQDWITALAPNFPYAHRCIYYGSALKAKVIIKEEGGIDFKLVSEELDPSFDPWYDD